MSEARPLLVELFVEELPPKALKLLGEAFAAGLAGSLGERGLVERADADRAAGFASPRRLAVRVDNVLGQAPDRRRVAKLMPVSVGLDASGAPTAALLKKLASMGFGAETAARLGRQGEGKAESLVLDTLVRGATLAEGLQGALDEAIARLPIPKLMTYQLADGWSDVHFVRPVHALVALWGSEVIPVTAFGLAADRITRGHRFEATRERVELRDAGSYEQQLRDEGAVIASFAERRAEIERQLQEAARSLQLRPVDDPALLDEVTALVERPNVLVCRFDDDFLAVPPECLILTMKANQKYFPLLDAQGRLTSRFLIVSNIRPGDPRRVIEGNERVVRPRLADARFFFDQDRRRPLAARVAGLGKVVYHGRLGSQGARIERVRAIAGRLATQADGEPSAGAALAAHVDRAALLAKADLLTDMVGEFPELQGVMGGYYARHDGEPEAVALAIEDHYRPRFAGDDLPRDVTGLLLALADKLETLAGLFGVGQLPSGDKDPFALRRHALGVIRIVRERLPGLRLDRLVEAALDAPVWPAAVSAGPALRDALLRFFRDRLVSMLRDEGHPTASVEAVLEVDFLDVGRLGDRLLAVAAFGAMPEAPALAAANKRVGNILKKSDGAGRSAVDPARLVEPAERALHEALVLAAPRADAAFEAGDYTGSLKALAALRDPVDAFFDRVMVNADDPALRANRLGLLARLHAAMNRVADLSRLAS
jgi:glycyl-tRNA synthetase beta chain